MYEYTSNLDDEDNQLVELRPTLDNALESTEEMKEAPKEINIKRKRSTAKWLVKEKRTQNPTDRKQKMENMKLKRVIKYIMNDQKGVECKHLPIRDDKPSHSRCKLRECNQSTHVMCEKCQIHLCSVKERNCFKKYHE